MITVFLADGFEEIEAITPIDILRRAGLEVRTCSITDNLTVNGAHGIPFVADTTIGALSDGEDLILLPGGMPGTLHLRDCKVLCDRILSHYENGGYLAAICAAPTVFGGLGILREHAATCYPGMEDGLFCKEAIEAAVVVSDRVVTSRGAGTAFAFALKLVSLMKDEETAEKLRLAMCFEGDLV